MIASQTPTLTAHSCRAYSKKMPFDLEASVFELICGVGTNPNPKIAQSVVDSRQSIGVAKRVTLMSPGGPHGGELGDITPDEQKQLSTMN
jgi:hypothetical protein